MKATLVALVCFLCACTQAQEATPADDRGAGSDSPIADTAAMRAFLKLSPGAVLSVLSRDDSYLAVLSTEGDTSYKIWFLEVSNIGLRSLRESDSLGPFKPGNARWIDMRGVGKGFVYSLYYPSEAVVSTILYILTPDGLSRTFWDGPTVCSPASLSRDASGEAIIVTFPDDLTGGNCLNECRNLLETVGADPSWPRVLRMEGGRWTETLNGVDSVYIDAAERYERMAQLLAASERITDCAEEEWATASAFGDRAAKARSVRR